MTHSLPRAPHIGSRQAVEALRKLTAEVGGLKAFEPGVREAIGNTHWTVLMQRLDEADAALSPLPSSSGTGWRPIETAPKDGTWILAVRNGFIPETCCWQEDRWIVDEDQPDDLTYNPDWWQPLPSAPVSHGGAE